MTCFLPMALSSGGYGNPFLIDEMFVNVILVFFVCAHAVVQFLMTARLTNDVTPLFSLNHRAYTFVSGSHCNSYLEKNCRRKHTSMRIMYFYYLPEVCCPMDGGPAVKRVFGNQVRLVGGVLKQRAQCADVSIPARAVKRVTYVQHLVVRETGLQFYRHAPAVLLCRGKPELLGL